MKHELSVKTPLLKEVHCEEYEEEKPQYLYHCNHPEGRSISEVLCYHTAEENAQSLPNVPCREHRGVGGATLVVSRHIYHHVLMCRIHMSVAEAYEECRHVISRHLRISYEEHIAQGGDDDALESVMRKISFPQRLASMEPREYQSYGENSEEGARATGDAQLFPTVEGQIVAENTIAEPEEDQIDGYRPPSRQEDLSSDSHRPERFTGRSLIFTVLATTIPSPAANKAVQKRMSKSWVL